MGFTLIETLVTISIVSLITAILVVSWPWAREQQAFTLATQVIASRLKEAQQYAINEQRPERCEAQRQCSVVGIAVRGAELVMFADTRGLNQQYDEAAGVTGDFIIQKQTLPSAVTTDAGQWQSWVFKAVPPNVISFGPTGEEIAPGAATSLILEWGTKQRTLTIRPYGHVE